MIAEVRWIKNSRWASLPRAATASVSANSPTYKRKLQQLNKTSASNTTMPDAYPQQQYHVEHHPHPAQPFSNMDNGEGKGCDTDNGFDSGRANYRNCNNCDPSIQLMSIYLSINNNMPDTRNNTVIIIIIIISNNNNSNNNNNNNMLEARNNVVPIQINPSTRIRMI